MGEFLNQKLAVVLLNPELAEMINALIEELCGD
jgi:hypothetical protein